MMVFSLFVEIPKRLVDEKMKSRESSICFFDFDFMNFSNFFQLHHGKGKKKPFPGILTGLITKEALGGLEKYQTLCRRCFLRD